MGGSSQTQKKYGEFYSKTERHTRNKVPYCQSSIQGKGDQIFIGVMMIDTGSANCILNKSILPYLAEDAAIEGKTMKTTPYRVKAWSVKGTRCRST